jgi:hypothetical protein
MPAKPLIRVGESGSGLGNLGSSSSGATSRESGVLFHWSCVLRITPWDNTGLSSRCMADNRNLARLLRGMISIGAITRPMRSG